MSGEVQPVYKCVGYKVASNQREIEMLIADGWEPHGSATITRSRSLGDPDVIRQPMVKREMISADEYMAMMETMIEVAERVMDRMR